MPQAFRRFILQNFVEAANYAIENNDMEAAMLWSDIAMNSGFPGQKNFQTLSMRAKVLNKAGKSAEAADLMKQALGMGSMMDLHLYGMQFVRDKKPKEALDIFKMNAEKNPNQYRTNMGLARGYSANGDYQNALKYIKLAEPQAPAAAKDIIAKMIKTLEEGKDIN